MGSYKHGKYILEMFETEDSEPKTEYFATEDAANHYLNGLNPELDKYDAMILSERTPMGPQPIDWWNRKTCKWCSETIGESNG